jgi:hypothetical protein
MTACKLPSVNRRTALFSFFAGIVEVSNLNGVLRLNNVLTTTSAREPAKRCFNFETGYFSVLALLESEFVFAERFFFQCVTMTSIFVSRWFCSCFGWMELLAHCARLCDACSFIVRHCLRHAEPLCAIVQDCAEYAEPLSTIVNYCAGTQF